MKYEAPCITIFLVGFNVTATLATKVVYPGTNNPDISSHFEGYTFAI